MASGIKATLVALVIGVLVTLSKSTYDRASGVVNQIGARIILLDRLLARYGPETTGDPGEDKGRPLCQPGAVGTAQCDDLVLIVRLRGVDGGCDLPDTGVAARRGRADLTGATAEGAVRDWEKRIGGAMPCGPRRLAI
jgi:hypothetical protein